MFPKFRGGKKLRARLAVAKNLPGHSPALSKRVLNASLQ